LINFHKPKRLFTIEVLLLRLPHPDESGFAITEWSILAERDEKFQSNLEGKDDKQSLLIKKERSA